MFHMRCSRFISLFVSFAVLVAPLPLVAMAEDLVAYMPQWEINNNDTSKSSYVYLGKDRSNIIEIITDISALDDQTKSPLIELQEYIEQGFFYAEKDAILDVLAYANTILQNNYRKIDIQKAQQLVSGLDAIMQAIIDGALTVKEDAIRTHLRTLIIDENIDVLGKTVFHKHVKTKQGIHTLGKLKVDKNAKFKKNVTIDGTLSAGDLVIGEGCLNNLCVNNLSAIDTSISGTLSANNAVIENLNFTGITVTDGTITNLSSTDTVIQNLTVINCMPELCVNNISVDNAVVNNALYLVDPGPGYIGLQAPVTVPTSYTLTFPAAIPIANQVLRANAIIPTNLEWATGGGGGGSILPEVSRTIYVATYGNDITGDGSFDNPYASLAKGISLANTLGTSLTPITIYLSTGIYIEDNSINPLTVTAEGVSIIGEVSSGVIVMPNTPTNDLLLINTTIHISDIAFRSFAPLATGITLTNGVFTSIINVDILNFLVGVECVGGPTNSYGFIDCFFADNVTGIVINDAYVAIDDITLFGTSAAPSASSNNAITITGTGANLAMDSGVIGGCETAITLLNNATAVITGTAFRLNKFDINQSGASHLTLSACTFELTTSSSDIDIQVNDAGSITQIVSCEFSGSGLAGNPEGTAMLVTGDATVNISGGSVHNYTTGITVGTSSDTSSTILSASALVIKDCTNDVIQQGSSTFNFNASTASSNKMSINNPTNVVMAFFDLDSNDSLFIGSLADQDTPLLQVGITPVANPQIDYLSSLYSTQAIGFNNPFNNPSSWFITSQKNANLTAVTADRTQIAGVRLVSDTASPVGGTSALRGWDINKNGSSAELSFNYQNSDSSGQSPVSKYTVMQLDGFNNQVQLPTAGTKIVFDTDTNLYRSASGVLKTDNNFIVGTLTPGKAVATDQVTNELISSVTTTTELGYVAGITSPIQAQLNNKVNRSGDSMTGPLTMLTQNPVRYSDAVGNYVGINAPLSVPANYTLSLPSTIPTTHQVMRANATTPTNLEWFTPSGSIVPTVGKVIYVTKFGNDITGDGSASAPFASLAQAINVANTLSTSSNPMTIFITAGIYIENNSAGPLTLTANGVSIIGDSTTSVIVMPSTPTNDLLLVTTTARFANMSLQSASPLATGLNLTTGNLTTCNSLRFINFLNGVLCSDGTQQLYGFESCLFISNATGLNVNNCRIEVNECSLFGTPSLSGPAVNTGLSITGSGANAIISGGTIAKCNIGFDITNNSTMTVSGVAFKLNIFDIIQASASHMVLNGSSFELTNGSSDVDIQISGVGTIAEIIGCQFNGNSSLGTAEGQCILVSNNASLDMSSGSIKNYNTAIQIGTSSDSASTIASMSGVTISNCTNDIIQEGSATLNFNAGTISSNKLIVNDATNVNLAYFDSINDGQLTIGSTTNMDTGLLAVDIGTNNPNIAYRSSLYSTQAVGLNNPLLNPTSLFIESQANANLTAITANRTDIAGIRLVSDTASPVGGTSALRGWDINKNGSSAQLSFNYQNTDSSGQPLISEYTVMQLDGVNNQLQLPTAGTQIVFDTDTNLYRSAANVLKTDSNLIVGALTPGKAVTTDSITNELISSITTSTELGYLSGATSPIQTQLNNKVSKTGDSMSGALNMLTQNAINFKDNGGNFVGIKAQATIPSSYTVSLPTNIPTARQILRANSTTPTNLEWADEGGSVIPAISQTVYVTKYGSDITGDGSFDNPYNTLSKAIDVANSLSSASFPIAIFMGPGNYIEDNSAGPLTVNTDGITITGNSSNTTFIIPNTLSNDLLLINDTINISNVTLLAEGPSTASGLSLAAGAFSTFNNIQIINFNIGASCAGLTSIYVFDNCQFISNGTGILSNDSNLQSNNCLYFGALTLPAANVGINISGAGSFFVMSGGSCAICDTAISINNNTSATINAATFKFNNTDIVQSGASSMTISASNFELTNNPTDINMQISDAGTTADIIGCEFNGASSTNIPQATALLVSNNAQVTLSSSIIKNYTTGIQVGLSTDTSSTKISASSITIINCTNDIIQNGTTTASVNASSLDLSSVSINDSTNVNLAIFDADDNNALTIGSTSNTDTILLQAAINTTTHPEIQYKSSLYSTQAIGFNNPLANPSSLFMQSLNNANLIAITTNRADIAGLRLVSDTGVPIGGTSALRGWDINKNATAAQLSFTYQNSDIVGQSAISPYVVMQLDGVNNQLQLPTAGTQIVFDGDTNLYRNASGVLKTDNNLIVGTLTPGNAVVTDASTNELSSSATTATELGYVHGVTSSIQTQINNKVSKTGDSMSGALNMLNQNAINFKDSTGNFVGINAQATVPTSYTLSLPTAIPTASQTLRAGAVIPINLEWVTEGGAIVPAVSEIIYVTQYGNDATGNGSFDSPYASLSKAITTANSLASSSYPILISIAPGIYIEDNSAGPLTITADGISIVGSDTSNSVTIIPNTPTNNFLLINNPIQMSNMTIESPAPLATGITISSSSISAIQNVSIYNFLLGVDAIGGLSNSAYGFDNCLFIGNGTGLQIDNAHAEITNSTFFGTPSLVGPPANNGLVITGSLAFVVISGSVFGVCSTGLTVTNNALCTANGTSFRINSSDIIQNGSSQMTLAGCTFEISTSSSDVNCTMSDAGTITEIIGCEFNGASATNIPQATAMLISNNAQVNMSSSIIKNYTTGIEVGLSTDTSSTILSASSITITNCTNDIIQEGTATLNVVASSASIPSIATNNNTNVTLAIFDTDDSNTLTVGSLADVDTSLLQVAIDPTTHPEIVYLSSLYSTQAIGFNNPVTNPSSLFMQSLNNANITAITTNRADIAGLRLVSDTGSPVGGTSALRGWDINKNATAAQLSFTYQNSDIVGQSAISPYVVMQLDGVNNQLQLPTAGTQIVFDTDTNLYRSASGVLKTDNNLIVGTLTPGNAVVTDASTNELSSSATTATELGYVHGVTSSIQTQINNKVSKTGDSMSGALNMLNQNAINFKDSTGNFVGINAQATVPTSYTLSLPTAIPTASQTLRAGAVTPTNLEWVTEGGAIVPAVSETIYVTEYGNDTTGNGSFDSPYASLSKAISIANSLASSSYPVAILIGPGTYIENNSAGPLTITTDGIAIIGDSPNTTTIIPTTLSNDLLLINNTINISNITFLANGASTATGLSLTAGNFATFNNLYVIGFNTGVSCSGVLNTYTFNNCLFLTNTLGINVNEAALGCNSCSFIGTSSLSGPPANTGIYATGSNVACIIIGGTSALCETVILSENSAKITANAVDFTFNAFDIIQNSASQSTISSCSFSSTATNTDIKIQVNGAGTSANITGTQFDGNDSLGVPQATCIVVTDNGNINVSSDSIKNYTTALQIGLVGDTASTILSASNTIISNCTNDIIQNGSSSLNINGSTLTSNKITINDPTNVTFAIFDLDDKNALTIGSTANMDTTLLQALVNNPSNPEIQYKASLYATQAIGINNTSSNPSSLFIQSLDNANLTSVTSDRTKISGIRLVSDTGSPVGGTSALRGWDIDKNATTAQLSFSYQNSDIVGQSVISPYIVMQLDGVNNQLQLPTAGTQIIFDTDTNLYRSAANVLKTDDNFIVGTLTPGHAVVTDPVTNQLESCITTNTELSYLSGTTSSVQTQLNNKVNKSGDTMTGTLQLPAGTAITPSLVFTGSTTTGLSAATSNVLSFDINGSEQMNLSSSGLTIDAFNTAGVVHNNSSGLLTTSLIVDADITTATIANNKLANISSSNVTGDIVVRDNSGNFATNMITIIGTTTNNTDVATKAYVDAAVSTGLVVHTPAVVVSLTNQTLSGFPTIDGVTFPEGTNRVLLTGQTNAVENGLWVVAAGAWTRPADFATGTTAGEAYVLILEGNTEAGSAWLCNTPTAIIDTNPITFALFSLPDTTTGANVGIGTGLIFRDKTGANINFKSLIQGSHMVITNNTSDITLATDGTSANTVNTLVARDGSGNFSAGTITASLTGHASLDLSLAGGTLTGALTLPAGTAAAPSIQFTGSTNTGISAATANTLSFDVSGVEQMNISSSGVTIDGFTTTGVVHNSAAGLLTSSLIVNADVDPSAGIVDTKLATISTAGKVANSATTATSANTANTIVLRDASGNFNAGTIIASLTGAASANVLKAGDTMTGTLQLPAGTTTLPSLVFTGSTTTGLSASSGALSFSTNGTEQLKISSGGTISVDGFTTAGVVHNDASGNLSSSLITNTDVSPSAAIVDTKLATISTAGKVANSATTATSANTANAIVSRDSSGNFSAGTITANLTGNVIGNVTGAASLNVLKAGDTMTGTLTMPAGSAAAPSIQFTGSTNTGLSAATANTLSFDISGIEQMNISSSGVTVDAFSTAGVVHNDATGLLSSSLIVNGDITNATISNAKLATISSTNTAGNIVVRDGSGNFAAGTITGNLIGNVTGAASLNVLKAGDTMTGTLQLPAGTTALPSLVFTGSTTTGLSANTGALSFSTNGIEQLKISSGGTISIDAFTTAGVVHNDTSGNLSSSLITNADIIAGAGITDNKLATISTAGKVANSATTATSANTANAIVSRDSSGNFSASTITANLTGNVTGNVTGHASSDLALTGGTLTGTLTLPAGTALAPSLQFTGSTNTGLSATTANTLSFDVSGSEQMKINASGVTIDGLSTAGVVHNSAAGLLSTSLIVDADITSATITNAKLATISSSNIANDIVVRDGSGNFAAGTITANLIGNVTGAASANVLKTGDTMTGTLQLPAGTTALPSLVFTGSTTTGLSANTGNLSLSTNGVEQLKISSGGIISIDGFTTTGIVHNDSSGNLSTSLIVNADISPTAAITDSKLATISTAGKVANSATTATSANTANAIVARDSLGNFSAGTITASLTGHASSDLPLTGGTLTGSLTMPAGTILSPSIKFTGSNTGTGITAATIDVLSFDIVGSEIMNIGASGVTIDGFTTTGVVHNSSAGLLTSSLIVNADVDPSAGIVDTKLATISTAGKVANSATTATSANTASAIVARDASGNFSAGTITASLTGAASANVLKAGDTMTGTLQLPAGTTALPSLVFTGSTTTGLSASASALSFSTSGAERLKISAGGTVSIDGFTTAGVVHNDTSGNLSSSLITNADIVVGAGITDNKLATITTTGKVANSATTATNLNTANAIVARDASGNFSAGTITANLTGNVTGNVTGSASLNVLKTGDTMTGALTMPAGSAAAPSIQFTGSTNTGISAATANTLSFDVSGVEQMNISSSGVTIDGFTTTGVVHNSSAGLLTSSLIVNADVDPAAGIVDTKLNTISTAGKVANSATTATSANTANAIVTRDASGNFSAGTITASLTGAASANVLKAGDTMTGTLQLPAGTTALPSLVFTGSTTTGLSASASALSFSTSGAERLKIASGGTISIDAFTSAGIVHNDASGNLSSSLIVNADISTSAAITDNKLNTISTAGKVANSATTATNTNTANAIVARDASGNFITNMITLAGTTTNPTDAATKAYVDAQVGSTGTNLNTPNTLVKRDGTGSFAAGLISVTDEVISNSVTITPFSTAGVIHNSAAGLLSSSLIVNGDITNATITNAKLAAISSSNIANDIVVRDASGNFSAGTITASLSGNATTATTATNFSGSLSGDVTGTQSATVVSFVGGQTAANVAAATVLANNATSANTASTIVKRDASGNFSAGTITANLIGNVTGHASSDLALTGGTLTGTLTLPAGTAAAPSLQFTGSTNTGISAATANVISFDVSGSEQMNISSSGITIDGLSTVGVVHNSAAGLLSTSLIVDADITAATITNDKLANISSSNVANDIVVRDGSGNFATNMITLTGTTTNPTDAATKAYVDAQVGGTSLNTPNTTVKRDGTGSFAAQEVSMNDAICAGNLVLSTNPSTSTAGNIMKGANRFIHNTGTSNTFVGITSGNFTTSGTGQNSALGVNALTANTTGANNVAIGYNTLPACTTGSGNVVIGSGIGTLITTGSNNIYINSNDALSATENLTIRIGSQLTNIPTACYIQGIYNGASIPPGHTSTVLIDHTTGLMSITSSSQRFKHNIVDMDDASSNIYKLHPVNFAYNDDATESKHYGLIAEEVDQVLPEIVTKDKNGKPFSVRYDVLPILLVQEMQKQQLTIQELQKDNAQFKDAIQQLMNRIMYLEARA